METKVAEEQKFAFPEIGTYIEVAFLLKMSTKTIYAYKSRFPRGVYLGHGRFNISRLKNHIEKNGTFLRETVNE